MERRVVVTGLGLVTPVGNTVEDTWSALVAGKSGAARIRRFDPSALDVTFGCEVKGFDPLAYLERKEAKRCDLFVQYAVAATAQAVQHAGLGRGFPAPERTGVLIGSGIGGIATFEEQCRTFIEKGPSRVSAFFVPMFIPDMASGLVAMRYGVTGPNFCTVSACASSAHAIGEAFRTIQRGDADAMIAGGAEAAITPLAIAGFANMKALSPRNDDPAHASRPFDKTRDGFVLGDGSGIVVLESLEHATARGATILAEVAGFGMSADAYHMTQPAPEGRGAQQAMRAALADACMPVDRIAYVNAHGTSTPAGDTAETQAVKAVFGPAARSLVFGSTKSMTGHLLGAAGGVEFAICTLVIGRGIIPPTINYVTPDPDCDLDCAPNRVVERRVDVAMSNSFGFGGHNVTLVAKRFAA
ncbi:MAG TPA: beta-ketoacyl-ACP synthase II [Gemmatimonadales bacterium]|nr:beta-ketoacyl-ACP synthase II [Gemmatimonadales bacterium]